MSKVYNVGIFVPLRIRSNGDDYLCVEVAGMYGNKILAIRFEQQRTRMLEDDIEIECMLLKKNTSSDGDGVFFH